MSEMTPNSQTGSAGSLIRQAREAQGMSIDTLSATIKVPPAKLLALEADNRTILPNANFNRALAMTVCRALKIDPAPILAQMPAAVATALVAAKPALNQPFRDFSDTGLTFDRPESTGWSLPSMSPAMLAPIVLLLLAGGIYLLPDHMDLGSILHKASEPAVAEAPASAVEIALPPMGQASDADAEASAPAESAASAVVAAPDAVVASQAQVKAPVVAVVSAPASVPVSVSVSASTSASVPAVANKPVVAATSAALVASTPASASGSAPKPVAARGSAAQVTPVAAASSANVASTPAFTPTGPQGKLSLSSKEPAWIEVRDGAGQRVFSRQLAAGEKVDLQGPAPLKVTVGNAPSVTVQFNGQPVDLARVTHQNVARIELK